MEKMQDDDFFSLGGKKRYRVNLSDAGGGKENDQIQRNRVKGN